MRLYEIDKRNTILSGTNEAMLEQIKTNASDAYQAYVKGTCLYRGIHDVTQDVILGDPSLKKRTSAYTANYYTLLMDTLPSWKAFPKRNKSIIMTTSMEKAKAYADYGYDTLEPTSLYQVFPLNGAKIAVCPASDIWDSFEKVFGLGMGDDWRGGLVNPLERMGVSDSSYIKMMREIFDQRRNIDKQNAGTDGYVPSTIPKIAKSFWHRVAATPTIQDMTQLFSEEFSPIANNFKLINLATNAQAIRTGVSKEAWTDSKCYLVNINSNLHRKLK